ncbi:MAG TPA: MCE family protein [Streptosporangiaceae bacterium]|nr:MCE family protein [Streptosporangiaceae bacterium]
MSSSDAIGRARRSAKRRKRLAGVAFLVTGAVAIWLSVALYNKQFSSVALVTVYTSSVGNEMHPGNQVMVRGVQVGEVRQVSVSGSGARLLLAMNPSQLSKLPANVSAEMLPTTLFGERYVDLVLPTQPTAATLTDGSVIRQNRSADALELEQVLNNLLPMLQAIQPDKLSLALTAIAQGLQGRGAELGQTLVTLNAWLTEINPQLPQFDTDIRRLAGLTKTYSEATPALLAALNNFAVNGQTLASHRFNYMALLANVKAASNDFRSFLDANGNNSVNLSNDSVPSLGILARYAPEFPCTLANLAEFVPEIDKVLGAGSNEPGLHVRVIVVPSLGPYKAGRDTPKYGDDLGPHCYEVPFKGIALNDGVHKP